MNKSGNCGHQIGLPDLKRDIVFLVWKEPSGDNTFAKDKMGMVTIIGSRA